MCVFSRLWATSVAPKTGLIPVALYVAFMFFFAVVTLGAERRVKQFLAQTAFILIPAAAMSLWFVHG
jgi:hypothetical protein